MTNKLICTCLLFTLLTIQLSSCKKSSSQSLPKLPTVTTSAPTFSGSNIQFNGEIVSLGDGYYSKGFCWGVNTNPVIGGGSSISADGSGVGPYIAFMDKSFGFTSGNTYNVRAYAQTLTYDYVYGNNITFTVP